MSGRILIVDDDRSHRTALEMHLSGSYEVMAVESAERALGVLARFEPDIVLTDVRMDGMDGFELLGKVREHRPDMDVILMTAYDDLQGVIDAMKAGAYDYLLKPMRLDDLDARILRCFRGREAKRKTAAAEPLPPPRNLMGLVGRDPRIIEIFKTIGQLAQTRAPVLIRGETGTGKEIIARTVHANSVAADAPFIAVNCTAIPETLLESELFGHVKGAFTGATGDRRGCFELAGEGTLFLDEIGDTTPAFQAKLLRVLQEKEFYPVGSEQPRRTSARVVAATHRPVERLVEEQLFREDLYFRLRVVEIRVPPLRERRGDVPLLVQSILERVSRESHGPIPQVPPAVMAALTAYDWPGNIRELENALTRASILAQGGVMRLEDLELGHPGGDAEPEQRPASGAAPEPAAAAPYAGDEADAVFTMVGADATLDDIQREHVARVLSRLGGNKSVAAKLLGISRPRLNRLLERFGLEGE